MATMAGHHLKAGRALRRLVVTTCVGGLSLVAGHASAQPIDENPPLPDVLLLTDTSGTMELMMDGCNTDTGLYPDGSGNGCCYNGTVATIPCVAPGGCSASVCPTTAPVAYCDGQTARTENRWGTEVAALTGDFISSTGGAAYSCFSMPRTPASAFASEFSYQLSSGALAPYDLNYYLNFHRPVENLSATTACAFGFSQNNWPTAGLTTNPAGNPSWNADSSASHQENPSSSPPLPDFQAADIKGYVYNTTTMMPVLTAGQLTPCTGGFIQDQDGLINYGLNSIRFGLMTIDSDPLPNTGVNVTSDSGNLTFANVAGLSSTATNMTSGMWSYYLNWETATAPSFTGSSLGRPAGCGETGTPCPPDCGDIGQPACPAGCGTIFFEVGGRSPAAPPWEGRMMRFPSGATTAPGSNNAQIMSALGVMRPYGANPIAGMMDDAKYYFWTDPQGPAQSDPLVSCRPQYIILLSHAAPNDDLQPACQGTVNGLPGYCPYDLPEAIAYGLANQHYAPGGAWSIGTNAQSKSGSGPYPVLTFVVGFALSTNLGDAGTQSCKDILVGPVGSQTVNPALCGAPGTSGPGAGTVYASCCALARIANAGGTQVPYFADNKTDLQAAFQAILAIIQSTASTRATPVLLPQSASASGGGGPSGALFLASFTPSTVSAWSGDVQRERFQCSSSGVAGTDAVDPTVGDDFATNLRNQTSSRNVIMVEPTAVSGTRNASGNIRPWVNGSHGTTNVSLAFDGYPMSDGAEWGNNYATSASSAISTNFNTTEITPDVLFPSGCTLSQPGHGPFSTSDCETIAIGYALGMSNPPATWNTSVSPFPTRYYTPGSVPPTFGPFGGVLHSTPAIEVPPNALLKDDSYEAFVQNYAVSYAQANSIEEPRHSVLYVATIDGVLHAFGVDYSATDHYTFDGASHSDSTTGTTGTANELWSFIPPAVLPQLMTGFAGGETVLLDGAPVVKDTVYQRAAVGTAEDWHSSLVAGFGTSSPGYYALDVTDPNFVNRGSTANFGPLHSAANSGTPALFSGAGTGYMSAAAPSGRPLGPHFLWQLTDPTLFAPTGGTPAIATISMLDPDATSPTNPVEIGVAILPGGASTPGSTTTGCTRICKGIPCTAPVKKYSDASPPGTSPSYELSLKVRQWTASGCPSTGFNGSGVPTNPARGRSITIVRLDNGEILRTFTPLSDIPQNHPLYTANYSTPSPATNAMGYTYQGRVTQAEFDSPISGTPMPYPAGVGADAQRIFVGDQDGVIWRLDVSNPDPNQWFVEPFYDAYNVAMQGTMSDDQWAAQERAPIVLAPSVSIDRTGNVVLNFGTGDVNAIGTASNQNYVASISEVPIAGTRALDNLFAQVNWYLLLPNAPGEMMTGPAAVFDGTYYFASYAPASGSGASACTGGTAYLWGMDFTSAADSSGTHALVTPPPSYGGLGRLLNSSNALAQDVPPAVNPNAIIPGITITSTATCAQTTTIPDPATGGSMLQMSNVSPASYQVSALQGKGGPNVNNAAVQQVSVAISVHTSTLVDAWASIVE
jgi:type IV pilus assembly protein PilY1